MTLDYFYGQAGELFSFYRIPKALFQEPRFQSLSTDAKTLYGILLDRMSLSVKNGWLDEQNRVFIIFTIEDVKRALCCADNKATKLLRELEKFGLIERKRRGLGKPSLVYCGHCGAKLTLTSSRKWRKLSDGTLDDTLRVRYTCYGKLRKQTGCTGQTGYTVHILDEIIDKSVRQIFSKMRGIPKEQIITRRYEREVVERKNHLQTIQVERDKAQKDLISLKAEILACIKGESVFPKETLAEMITAQEEKLRELDALYESSYAETEKTAELMDNVSKLYEELISFSDLYDSASFEAKKMIVNQLIRRVDVYRGYQLNITFNFDLTPYIEGDDTTAC